MLGQQALCPLSPPLSSYLCHFSPLGHDTGRAEDGREHLELGEDRSEKPQGSQLRLHWLRT